MSERMTMADAARHNAKVLAGKIKHENHRQSQSPVPEPAVRHESVATQKGKGTDTTRLQVRVVSHRRRLCDVDNLCPKYFIDCLRYAEIIKDDAPKYIALEVTQVQSKTDWTELTIEPL